MRRTVRSYGRRAAVLSGRKTSYSDSVSVMQTWKSGDGAGARQTASNKAQFENFKRTQRANFNSKAGFSAGGTGSSSSFTQKNPFSSGNPFGEADNPFARNGAGSPEQFAEMLRKNRQKQRKIREIVTAATIVVIFLLVVFSR